MRRILTVAGTVFACACAHAGVFGEVSGSLWMPFWGAFKFNHNLGAALHARAGWEFRPGGRGLELENLGYARFSVFAHVYHSWNSLDRDVWEVQDGKTVKSGNIFFAGVGGRALLLTPGGFSLMVNLSLGIMNEYPPEGTGSHFPPKNEFISMISIGGGYHVLEYFYLFLEYLVASPGTYTDGWHELGAGVGVSF